MRVKTLFAIIIFIIFILPIAILAVMSLANLWAYPHLLPENLSLDNYRYIAENAGEIFFSLLSSLSYSLITVALTFAICVVPASVFARHDFRFKHLAESILLVPALVPSMTFSMGLHYVFLKIGMADNFFGIVLALSMFGYPYMLRALTAGYMTFGEEFAACAKNLGADFFTVLFRVELPMLVPAVVAGGSVVFLVAFSEYFLVMLLGGGTVPSFATMLFPYLNSSEKGLSAALTLIFFTVPVILFFIVDGAVRFMYRKRGMV